MKTMKLLSFIGLTVFVFFACSKNSIVDKTTSNDNKLSSEVTSTENKNNSKSNSTSMKFFEFLHKKNISYEDFYTKLTQVNFQESKNKVVVIVNYTYDKEKVLSVECIQVKPIQEEKIQSIINAEHTSVTNNGDMPEATTRIICYLDDSSWEKTCADASCVAKAVGACTSSGGCASACSGIIATIPSEGVIMVNPNLDNFE